MARSVVSLRSLGSLGVVRLIGLTSSFCAFLAWSQGAVAFQPVELPSGEGPGCAAGRVCAPAGGFTAELRRSCKAMGGGDACDSDSYSLGAYHTSLATCAPLHGLELCLGQPCGEGGDLVCSVDLERFPTALQNACLGVARGSEDPVVCYKTQIPRALYRKSLAACLKGGSQKLCLSEAASRARPEGAILLPRLRPEWRRALVSALATSRGRVLLEHDADALDPTAPAYCPRYASLGTSQRIEYWVGILANIARWESDFDPGAINDGDPGGGSWGLMQMSPAITARHKLTLCPALRSGEDLLVAETNLKCGVDLLARQVERRSRIFLSLQERFYWRVLEVYGDDAIRPAVAEGFIRVNSAFLPCFVAPPPRLASGG